MLAVAIAFPEAALPLSTTSSHSTVSGKYFDQNNQERALFGDRWTPVAKGLSAACTIVR
jgi:hypothetical protein